MTLDWRTGQPARIVVLGTGTGVGKTYVSRALTRALAESNPGLPVAAVKPIESGLEPGGAASDSRALAAENTGVQPPEPHPLYGFEEPISPHLAARKAGRRIELGAVVAWLERWERLHWPAGSRAAAGGFVVIESAGGVFTPLGDEITNLELARALEPALWVLVAPDSLGVLHELTATLRALDSAGRPPELVVLSEARDPDASTGTNAAELRRLGIVDPAAVFEREGHEPATLLARRVMRALAESRSA